MKLAPASADVSARRRAGDERGPTKLAVISPRPPGARGYGHNLPEQLTSFVGREHEIDEVRRLLGTTRLLTLTGSGGVGKTRLALQVASTLLGDYRDGVRLVELATVDDPALVEPAVAATLGVQEGHDRSLLLTLAGAVRPRQLLLILDNCEHLIETCALLAEGLLRACPRLRILATSREPIGIAGETRFSVPSLELPELDRPPSAEELARCEAVWLFVDRAAAVLPGFSVSEENAACIAEVCRQLDGIPLAIELAAARIGLLSVEQIKSRLNDRFRLLAGGSRADAARHQTLRALVDWSYDLLSEPERALFRRLAVFSGGWSLEASEAVCADGDVLDLLGQLVAKSLVLMENRHGEARYWLLEMIRQYALEKLHESSDDVELRNRHLEWFKAFAERADPELRGPDQVSWLDRLEAEHDNLRAALASSLHEDSDAGSAGLCRAEGVDLPEATTSNMEPAATAGLRLATALSWFWRVHNHFSEGRRWLEATLAASPRAPASLRVQALVGNGLLAFAQGDYKRARTLLDEGLALARSQGDSSGIGWSLNVLGRVTNAEGDRERATALFEQSLAPLREAGDRGGYAWSVYFLGLVAQFQHAYERAARLLEEGLAIFREVGDKWGVAWALIHRSGVAFAEDDYQRALAHTLESLALCQELHTAWGSADCLDLLAWLAAADRRPERAVRLCGAAAALRECVGLSHPIVRTEYDLHLASVRARLSEAAFEAAWTDGQAMPLERAVEYALSAQPGNSSDAERLRPAPPDETPFPLTAREREVAALIAQGLTNREIAAELVITRRTAESHVGNILRKVGLASRAHVAVWAAEQGMRSKRQ